MAEGPPKPKIAAVVLGFNHDQDIPVIAEQLARQDGIHFWLIIVDNASSSDSLSALRAWVTAWRADVVRGRPDEVREWIDEHPGETLRAGGVFLVENQQNTGYSAGNNVGIRIADQLGADAVLIANPDMRIEDTRYLEGLYRHLTRAEGSFVAASRIVGDGGKDENPLREPSFLEELAWPVTALRRRIAGLTYVVEPRFTTPRTVAKVSGCCFLMLIDAIRVMGMLDEQVFLYCEEPILAARVRAAGGAILFVPGLTARHARRQESSTSRASRMRWFIRSRLYYLRRYSEYGRVRLAALTVSYALLAVWNRGGMEVR